MRNTLIAVALVFFLALGMELHSYKRGYAAGYRAAQSRYEGQITERVEQGIKGDRRVMAIRERSAYSRGVRSCQEPN